MTATFFSAEFFLWLLGMASFIVVATSDPGVVPKITPEYELFLLSKQKPDKPIAVWWMKIKNLMVKLKWCATCHFYRPPRVFHCTVCDRCIEIFDHHCPWINNCIGRRNFKHFLSFLTITTAQAALGVWVSCAYLTSFAVRMLYGSKVITNNYCYSTAMVCCIYAPSLSYSLKPLISFIVLHFRLLFDGRTTKERLSRIYEECSKTEQSFRKSPFHEGWYQNLANIFFEPAFTSFLIHTPHKSEIVQLISHNKSEDDSRVTELIEEPVVPPELAVSIEEEYVTDSFTTVILI